MIYLTPFSWTGLHMYTTYVDGSQAYKQQLYSQTFGKPSPLSISTKIISHNKQTWGNAQNTESESSHRWLHLQHNSPKQIPAVMCPKQINPVCAINTLTHPETCSRKKSHSTMQKPWERIWTVGVLEK